MSRYPRYRRDPDRNQLARVKRQSAERASSLKNLSSRVGEPLLRRYNNWLWQGCFGQVLSLLQATRSPCKLSCWASRGHRTPALTSLRSFAPATVPAGRLKGHCQSAATIAVPVSRARQRHRLSCPQARICLRWRLSSDRCCSPAASKRPLRAPDISRRKRADLRSADFSHAQL
jgi:hypothetical protein